MRRSVGAEICALRQLLTTNRALREIVKDLKCAHEAMRHEFVAKGTMANHYPVEQRRDLRRDLKGREARISHAPIPLAQSVLVIAGLSALGWAAIIAVIAKIWAVL
jgi:hypothetical protein